jgi:uncharacterized protein
MAIRDLNDDELWELDQLLARVPAPFEPLDLVGLDGFLCGVLVQPVAVPFPVWSSAALDWAYGETLERFGEKHPAWKLGRFGRLGELMRRRHAYLAWRLERGDWFDPIVDGPGADEGSVGEVLAPWVLGFEQANDLFPGLVELEGTEGAADLVDLLACVRRHLPMQDEEEVEMSRGLDQDLPLGSLDDAIEDLVGTIHLIYRLIPHS